MPEQLKELEDLRGMGQEGVLVTLINIRHDIADLRADVRINEKKAEDRQAKNDGEIAISRRFESKTEGQFGVIKGIGGTLSALFIGVLGWTASQIWAHSVALESLPDFKIRVTAIAEEQTRQNGAEVSNSGRIDKLEQQEAARHK